jgi:hypothetical protein
MKIEKVCGTCGSVEVWVDAYWRNGTLTLSLGSTFDNSWCRDCDAETNIINQEIKETTS